MVKPSDVTPTPLPWGGDGNAGPKLGMSHVSYEFRIVQDIVI